MENELKSDALNIGSKGQHDLRKTIIRMLKDGKKGKEIAKDLGVSEGHVSNVKKLYEAGGVAALKPKKRGRPKKEEAAAEQTTQNATEATEPAKTKKTTAKKSEHDTVETGKPKKVKKSAHSVWCSDEVWENLLLNCDIRGIKVTDATQEAIEAYLESHKPKAEQKRNYRQKEMERLNKI